MRQKSGLSDDSPVSDHISSAIERLGTNGIGHPSRTLTHHQLKSLSHQFLQETSSQASKKPTAAQRPSRPKPADPPARIDVPLSSIFKYSRQRTRMESNFPQQIKLQNKLK